MRDPAYDEPRTGHDLINDLERRVAELEAGIDRALHALGPGDDEDSDSPGNMAFACLIAVRGTPVEEKGEQAK